MAPFIKKLFFGDNLPLLKEYIQDETAKPLHLDQPSGGKTE